MRLNGLTLALAALLALPVSALAQSAPEAVAEPAPEAAAVPDVVAVEPSVATTEAAPVDATAIDTEPSVEGPSQVTADDAGTVAPEPPVGSSESAESAAVPADADGSDTPTDAERDFNLLYGGPQQYDPVADPNVPAPVDIPGAYDPWEKYNRKMHRFNNAVDRRVARPLARGYVRVVPRPMRLGVSNFFSNLGQPVAAVNSLLQGKPKQAGQALGRFVVNSTLGIGGIFDPASDAKLPHKSEDFGQTLGVWGWKRSRYVELPLFGPRTVRDTFGMVGDAPLSPLRSVEADRVRIPLQGLQLVDVRAQLLSTDSLREGAEDDYALVRDAWSQRRDYQIFGDRQFNGEDLPDYLRDEDSNPTVPVDAMPVMPTDGG